MTGEEKEEEERGEEVRKVSEKHRNPISEQREVQTVGRRHENKEEEREGEIVGWQPSLLLKRRC